MEKMEQFKQWCNKNAFLFLDNPELQEIVLFKNDVYLRLNHIFILDAPFDYVLEEINYLYNNPEILINQTGGEIE